VYFKTSFFFLQELFSRHEKIENKYVLKYSLPYCRHWPGFTCS